MKVSFRAARRPFDRNPLDCSSLEALLNADCSVELRAVIVRRGDHCSVPCAVSTVSTL